MQNAFADAFGGFGLNLRSDALKRFFHGEEEIVKHMERGGPGFHFHVEDVVAVHKNCAAFVDAVEFYDGHFLAFCEKWCAVEVSNLDRRFLQFSSMFISTA